MWTLGRIWIYPIKSLPGVEVARCWLLPAGNLQHDREFALVDVAGQVMNAKRTPEIHRIRAQWDLEKWSVSLAAKSAVKDAFAVESRFHLDQDRAALGDWFSAFFEMPLELIQQPVGGFPDDSDSPGPTVVSTASLQTIANWFPELNPAEIRQRFRANLELDGGEPFGEDRLVADDKQTIPFQVGEATLFGTNPCQRCVVPTRSPTTGEILSGFQKRFAKRREAELPPWANRSRFDHFYRLTVNTQVRHTEPQLLQVGDSVRVTL